LVELPNSCLVESCVRENIEKSITCHLSPSSVDMLAQRLQYRRYNYRRNEMADNAAAQLSINPNTPQYATHRVLNMPAGDRNHAACAAPENVLAHLIQSVPAHGSGKVIASESGGETAPSAWNISFGSSKQRGDEPGSQYHGPVISSVGRTTMPTSPDKRIAGWSFRCDEVRLPPASGLGASISTCRRQRQIWDAVLSALLAED
jgi:hypothetical protein